MRMRQTHVPVPKGRENSRTAAGPHRITALPVQNKPGILASGPPAPRHHIRPHWKGHIPLSEAECPWDLDSDHPWFDVEAVLRVKMRTEGWSRDEACERVRLNLELLNYNPAGWCDRQLNGDPEIELVSCTFVPQGYRMVDPTPIPSP